MKRTAGRNVADRQQRSLRLAAVEMEENEKDGRTVEAGLWIGMHATRVHRSLHHAEAVHPKKTAPIEMASMAGRLPFAPKGLEGRQPCLFPRLCWIIADRTNLFIGPMAAARTWATRSVGSSNGKRALNP